MADGECTDTCKGNKNQACGGSWKLAVYENPSFRHSEYMIRNLRSDNLLFKQLMNFQIEYFNHKLFFFFPIAAIVKKGMDFDNDLIRINTHN